MRKRFVCILSLGMLAACGDGGPTEPQMGDATGVYHLATYDGKALPVSEGPLAEGVSRRILAGSLVLDADGTCSLSETVVHSEGGQSRTEVVMLECEYEEVVAGRLDLRLTDASGNGTFPGFVQSVSYVNGSVHYFDFHNAREYRRVQP